MSEFPIVERSEDGTITLQLGPGLFGGPLVEQEFNDADARALADQLYSASEVGDE